MIRKLVFSCGFLLLISCDKLNIFSAGSYAYSEDYTIALPKQDVIKRVDSIKIANGLEVPPFKWGGEEVILKGEESNNNSYTSYIYVKETNQIMLFYVRNYHGSNDESRVGLISIRNGLSLGDWKTVNKDLSKEENDKVKKIFKDLIISKLR